METDSLPPSCMNLTDIMTDDPDEEAANLCASPAQETIAVPVNTFSAASSPQEQVIKYDEDLQTRIGNLFDYELFFDVTFLAGPDQIPIKAHKLILSMASPVFASMFYGDLKSENDISTPDCKPEAFSALLLFVYKNEKPLIQDIEKCIDVLYIARKYCIRSLEDSCHLELCSKIRDDNVFDILDACSFYELSGVSIICWEYIAERTNQVLKYHMPGIDRQTLTTILECNYLSTSEVDLFNHFQKWAENECVIQELEPTPANKRIVSEGLIKLIRFPTMTSTEFADHVVPSEMLTVEEQANVFTHITASPGRKPQTDFRTDFRTPKITVIHDNSRNVTCVFEYGPIYTPPRRRMASASRRRNRH